MQLELKLKKDNNMELFGEYHTIPNIIVICVTLLVVAIGLYYMVKSVIKGYKQIRNGYYVTSREVKNGSGDLHKYMALSTKVYYRHEMINEFTDNIELEGLEDYSANVMKKRSIYQGKLKEQEGKAQTFLDNYKFLIKK